MIGRDLADFALIGHSDSWAAAGAVLRALRGPGPGPISDRDVRQILPWIPPRTVCRVLVRSETGAEARGTYIDTFIPPDELDTAFLRSNLRRIREAAACAIRQHARVATLGGFSSIVLEGRVDLLPQGGVTVFTTGNTLTVAYIVHGIEEAVRRSGRLLSDLSLLVVGATGDVGSGCARYLASRVGRLLLCGRNSRRLRENWELLQRWAPGARASTDVNELLPDADVILCAASLPFPSLDLLRSRPGVIVCDAGYPTNVRSGGAEKDRTLFSGGLGRVRSGFRLQPDLSGSLTRHPFPNVSHGCLLEGMLLALERRFESFSRGRGNITPEKVDEIWRLAQKHGFELAPFFHGETPSDARAGSALRQATS